MRLAVTEACTNVVRHAYDEDEPGADRRRDPARTATALDLIVCDYGRGIGPSPDLAGPGLGLPLIAALADAVELERRPSRGSRLAMSFRVPRPGWGVRVTGPEPATTVSIASGPLVGPILRRVVGMLAARADLPLDRLDDAVLVADLIAARAPAHSIDDKINVALDPGDRSLLLRIGPLRQGGGQALIVDAAVPGVGNVIEQLADELSVTPEGETEFLLVRLAYTNGR